ncbi:hypothetical protein Mal4_21870 [Maioricimonas rarisocia]|uniref:Uncharacterized protein n=1 Tax=Maioricimonas rarisocia TaxID=2528026 RepID=A0A517Z5U9_9PLAN|nr:hypothetical protein Mal4_21870 [Maioricimonas rarisocia]
MAGYGRSDRQCVALRPDERLIATRQAFLYASSALAILLPPPVRILRNWVESRQTRCINHNRARVCDGTRRTGMSNRDRPGRQ